MSETRTRMVDAALELFHRRGVHATSVDQVLAKSRTGKSQFSHYFKNKDGLVRAVLERLREVIRDGKAPTGYDIRSWDDLDAFFQRYIDFQKSVNCDRSCPIGTIGAELTAEQKKLRAEILVFFDWSRRRLAAFFAAERLPDPRGLADFCLTIVQGGMLLAKIERNPKPFSNAARQALEHLRALRKNRVSRAAAR